MFKNKWIYYIKELAFLLLCSLFLFLYYFYSKDVPQPKALIYPNFLMVVTGIIILWNIIGTVFKAKKQISEAAEKEKEPISSSRKQYSTKVIIFVSAVIFIFISEILGFWVTTFIYLLLLSYYLGIRVLKKLIPQSIIITAILFGLFELWLNLDLPKGFFF